MKWLALAVVVIGAALAVLLTRRPLTPPVVLLATPPAVALPIALAEAPADSAVVMWVAQALARFEPGQVHHGVTGILMITTTQGFASVDRHQTSRFRVCPGHRSLAPPRSGPELVTC